ncbi:SRPBCC domain-containing protein [Sphingobacterium sp. E70]|uniref:SRPBCC domain-containing protein n=1 Tax=Sphingobacterium sp. E70 TaxID=2853439 RepID=UPI00211BE9CD|nr:SRPBCC domain-containing protein [Sphingobacterium sp. E70]ULT24280.1 SRPBCC domain-containing protein [Sphingobacterium sp. E70]
MKKNFAKAEMFIRKDVAEVFQAMVDPAITTKIWFTKSTGKLEKGKTIEWEWEMYNHKVNVEVLEIVENQTIIFNWRNHDSPSIVEWKFKKITGEPLSRLQIHSNMQQQRPSLLRCAIVLKDLHSFWPI